MAIPPIIPVVIPAKLSAGAPKLADAARRQNDYRQAMTSRRMIRWALTAGLCLLILGGVAFYLDRTYCSPRNSMRALASAIDRRDRDAIAEYVDASALAESLRRCTLELVRREVSKQNSNDIIDRLLIPLAEQLASGLAEGTFTPDSVISMLCGESPKDAVKSGVARFTDKTVDAFTKDTSPKTQVFGTMGKVLLRGAAGYIIDESERDNVQHGELNADDYDVATQYENATRYLITLTHRTSDDPAVGFVLKRHGLTSWKFTEVRLLPHRKPRVHAALVL